jgi:beta-N-acetylhexosaminidase
MHLINRPHGRRLGGAGYAPLALALVMLSCLASARTSALTHGALAASQPAASSRIDRLLTRMTMAEKIGQLFMVPVDGTALTQMVHDWHVGGLILYGGDIVSASQGRALLASARRAAAIPLLIATDEEGGEVNQIPAAAGVQQMPAPGQYGSIGSTDRVYQDALVTGRQLRALGVNMDLAPVLDVLVDPNSPIGDRSYGADPALVTRLGAAAIRGYQTGGVAATAKHFLGLGSVSIDLHKDLPTITRSRRQLEQVELAPMRAAIAAGVDALMVTHAAIPALDPTHTPASLSRTIVTGFIRGHMGYHGLIITDSLAMGGLSTRVKSNAEATVRAIAAGNDMALISTDPPTIRGALDAVEHAVATGRISPATIDAAVHRVLTLKAKLGLLPR